MDENSKLRFFADANDFYNTLKFEGDYADLNNYYAYKNKVKQEVQNNFQTAYGLSEGAFLKFVDSTKNVMSNKLKEVPSISDNIERLEKNAIGYYAQGLLRDYQFYHPYASKNKDYVPSANFKEHIKKTEYSHVDDFYYSQDYNQSLLVGVMRDAGKLKENDTTLSQGDAEMKILAKLENDSIRESLLATYAEMSLSLMKEGKREYYDKYLTLSKNKEQQEKVAKLYKSLTLLESGNPSPKFVDYENYAGGKTSLDDFKGKYVYIDVWATWCGPCKAEIPHLKEIEKQFHDKNIAFVSISVDTRSDYQKWKNMIAEKEMGGVQLFANDAFNSGFIKGYQIRGIPQFILLDPQGNIVNAQAPRPSEKELLTTLFKGLNI
jgi:thiol-disulfide isomerase/thioredoxin